MSAKEAKLGRPASGHAGPKTGNDLAANFQSPDATVKATPKRWIILVLFSLNSFNKALQWIQVPAATTKATVLYGVDNWVINLTSIVFMVSFLFMSWPACLIIDKLGIRKAVIISSLGATIGSATKWLSCRGSASVSLMLLGCLVVSLSEQMIFSVPSRLVSVWFPDHQVSLAMSFCIQGSMLGVALGFMVPQWFLMGTETLAEISAGFEQVFAWTAALSITLFLCNCLLLDEAPRHAPGLARLKQIELERNESTRGLPLALRIRTMLGQVAQLFRNGDFMLVAVAYGVAFGRSDTIMTLMDQTMGALYPEDDSVVGWTGCLFILGGALGLPIWGRALDKWRAYKRVFVVLTATTSLSLVLLAYATIQLRSIPAVYAAAMLFGLFHTGFLVVGLEFGVELTYPAPELVTTSLLNVMPSFIGPFFVLAASYVVDHLGALVANCLYLATLLAGLVLIANVDERLKRQDAIRERQAGAMDGKDAP